MPWLLFYGFGIVGCLVAHLYYTSLCWREEKVGGQYDTRIENNSRIFQIIGLVCLCMGFLFLVLWSLVWIVSAKMTEKSKTIISMPSPLGFQRL